VGNVTRSHHFGGDQFTVLLEDVASVDDTVRVARRIEEGLRRPLDLGGLERAVTTSIGIGLSTPQWEPQGEIVRRRRNVPHQGGREGPLRGVGSRG
jgi:GGDEF domain-containing protein